jgi:hypothetical protein
MTFHNATDIDLPLDGWFTIDDVEPPKPQTMKTLPNWFKRQLAIRRATLKNLKGQRSGHCALCNGRYLLYIFPDRKNNKEFQGTNCAGWFRRFDQTNLQYVMTGYGSDFDGCVFKVNNPFGLYDNNNCCDYCIINNIKDRNFEFIHNYFYRTYNPKFEELNKQILGKYFEYYEVASQEEITAIEEYRI